MSDLCAENAHIQLRRRLNEKQILKEKLEEIRALADTLLKLIKVGRKALSWAANPLAASIEMAKDAAGVIDIQDVAIVAIGEASNYLSLQREIKRLTKENEQLLDKQITQQITAGERELAGWKLMSRGQQKHAETYRKTVRRKAIGTAREGGGELDEAQLFLMAQNWFDMAFFGRSCMEELNNMTSSWKTVYDWLSGDLPRVRSTVNTNRFKDGMQDEDLYFGPNELLFDAMHTLGRNVSRVGSEHVFLEKNLPQWELVALEWRTYLEARTGLDFRDDDKKKTSV